MIYGLSHVDVPVTNLSKARRFYCEVLGFPVKKELEGACDLDAASGCIRLLETDRIEHRVSLRIAVSNVEEAFARLIESGARQLYAPFRTPNHELMAAVEDPDAHRISVWRDLTEDEYGFLPELPKQSGWEPDAEALLKSLLTKVPALFRSLARWKVSREAEVLATGRAVGREDVVRAYIRASARPNRVRVRQPLRDHGYDPDRYAADFDA